MAEPKIYSNLKILMTDLMKDGQFRVRVEGTAPDGREMHAGQFEKPRFKPEDFKVVNKLANGNADQDELIALGKRLADLMLPGTVRDIFNGSLREVRKNGERLRVRLLIAPLVLAALPWEYALLNTKGGEATGADFLALDPDVSITRYEATGDPLPDVQAQAEFKLVVALANPTFTAAAGEYPPLKVDQDRKAIEAAVNALNSKGKVVQAEVVKKATRDTLGKALKGGHILHFAGHGAFEETGKFTDEGLPVKNGVIFLMNSDGEEDPLPSEQLVKMLEGEDLRLVVLGACNTAKRDEAGAWGGMAPALVRQNIPSVVAMQFEVEDSNAATFIANLYSQVLQGYTIDEAVFEGRKLLFTKAEDWAADRDWGTPVLYLRTDDGLLFPFRKQVETTLDAAGNPLVNANVRAREVLGTLTVVDIGQVLSGTINANADFDKLGPGSNTTVVKIDVLGSPLPARGGNKPGPST